jgi:hypothetical protein
MSVELDVISPSHIQQQLALGKATYMSSTIRFPAEIRKQLRNLSLSLVCAKSDTWPSDFHLKNTATFTNTKQPPETLSKKRKIYYAVKAERESVQQAN